MSERALNRGWYCERCGRLDPQHIVLYQPGMFNTHSKRLDPHCAHCGTPVTLQQGSAAQQAGAREVTSGVLVLNGTCASGKSTLSFLLSEQHGYIQIDGDWVQQWMKERGLETKPEDVHRHLADMAVGLAELGRPVVLAHIIPPDALRVYRQTFENAGIVYRVVILMPETSTLLRRNEQRKCWPKTTPEFWVMKFHNEFLEASSSIGDLFYDNTGTDELETTRDLARLLPEAGVESREHHRSVI